LAAYSSAEAPSDLLLKWSTTSRVVALALAAAVLILGVYPKAISGSLKLGTPAVAQH
jgi:NADH:ubiquinone oxidoreductase subunit 4 (subunit M)